jgi:hypothetical protein
VEICTVGHMIHRGCVSCVAQALARMSLDAVENWFRQGRIDGDALAGYRHVWATSAVRSAGYDAWRVRPVSDAARAYVEQLRTIRGL